MFWDKKTLYWFPYKNCRFWLTDFYLAWNRTTRWMWWVWLYDMIDICTTQSISALHNRYLYYTIDFCTTPSVFVLHNRYLYYTIDICTRQSISVLDNLCMYYTIDICTTQPMSVSHNRFLYYSVPSVRLGITQCDVVLHWLTLQRIKNFVLIPL